MKKSNVTFSCLFVAGLGVGGSEGLEIGKGQGTEPGSRELTSEVQLTPIKLLGAPDLSSLLPVERHLLSKP